MSLKDKFAERFGDDMAKAVQVAASEHEGNNMFGRIGGRRVGSDHFRYTLLIVIGFECISRPEFMKHHGITADPDELKAWVVGNAELELFDGNHPDSLALYAGVYDEWYSMEQV